MSKSLEQQLQDLNVKFDDSVRNTQDLSSNKSRLEAENSELARQLHEVESQVRVVARARSHTDAHTLLQTKFTTYRNFDAFSLTRVLKNIYTQRLWRQ